MLNLSTRRTDLARNPRPTPFSLPALPLADKPGPRGLHTVEWTRMICAGAAILALSGGQAVAADPPPPVAPSIDTISDSVTNLVTEAAQRFGIPSAWIRAVMRAESAGNPRAVSPKGAMGLMQIMPQTWASLRLRYGLGADPFDVHDNILAGAAYLRELFDHYGAPGFLAAYNAGPARYEAHLATGLPLPAETQAYLAGLTPIIGGAAGDRGATVAPLVRTWTQAPLFAPHPDDGAAAKPPAIEPTADHPSTNASARDWTGLAPQSEGLFAGASNRVDQP